MGRDFVFYYFVAVMVHEVGHAIVMVMLGVEFYPIIFVPFFGAFVRPKTFSSSLFDEAMIAAGGPILGTLAAILLVAIGRAQNSLVLIAASQASFVGTHFEFGLLGCSGRRSHCISDIAMVGSPIAGVLCGNTRKKLVRDRVYANRDTCSKVLFSDHGRPRGRSSTIEWKPLLHCLMDPQTALGSILHWPQ